MSLVTPSEAAVLLKNSDVVALPTETVYGLAGRIGSDKALLKIFSTKKRPFFDPLIVHVPDVASASRYGEMDPVSAQLAQKFWPGPLTLVLPKTNKVSDYITNGGPTVALRSPDHPLFLNILADVGEPLAAPSANMFGKTSPTHYEHVLEEFNSQVPVVDGGPCSQGLESTIVGFDQSSNTLRVLRPGVISEKMLCDFFENAGITAKVKEEIHHQAPGHLKNHYQPTALFIRVENHDDTPLPSAAKQLLREQSSGAWKPWALPDDPELAARSLYKDLRNFSKQGDPFYLVTPPHWREDKRFRAIDDRLLKASHGTLLHDHQGWSLQSKP